ncbi:ABC transporter permease [Pyramidobacter piscolens]|uniref:ABC transporter permease n=1 Tax=Pyramidobacter piscolens TaxID=638849 RepID=UPI0026656DAF|nr:ABC transporter permease [Pyramidobacter piscolens]
MQNFILSCRKILFVIQKELLCTVKDPKSRVIMIVPVLLQTLLFGFAASYDLDEVPYALLDLSHSRYANELIAQFDGSGVFKRVRVLSNFEQIADCLDSGQAAVAICIGANFAALLTSGNAASVQVITDGRNTMTSGVIVNYVAGVIAAYNTRLRGGQLGVAIRTINWYNPNLITRWMFLPGLLPMMSLVQVMILAGLSVAREREQGTFDQLLVTPLTPVEILVGKAVPPVLIGLAQVTAILMISVLYFSVRMVGSLLTLYLVLLVFLISSAGIGLSISAVADRMQQVIVYCFVILLPVILLSGMATPIQNMPPALQVLTCINPLRFAIEAVRRIYLEGAGVGTIFHDFIPMLAVATLTLPAAAWLFRHKLL